ncbi:type IV pilin N-terminal domain-containing protein [Methanonatronarchaeum sp. AMET-Sl]|uniref:type IV pilin N-terminal domain-containing protein n=1 Tax=Methanonatronarchaeum sp. AMET-Sl TaxID=3037654 RepID=UPI00244E1F03|nr:type IV pilin N-terminal domain-containing protein [Methanonatronarchaeum sp. AMET-Sl]WGI17791.1 type IV pilin N-terminal domain-containing protein [Methanonatronarchaeum sp. AMET-Sl]
MRKNSNQKNGKTRINPNNQGVSSVVGVIIMVSIVTLMAAIAGAFVMGAITIPEPAPTTSISIEEINEDEIRLIHNGGDTLHTEDLRIIIYNLDTEEQNNRIDLDSEELESEINKEQWNNGERIDLNLDEIDVSDGDRIDIRVMHTSSQTTLYSELKTH